MRHQISPKKRVVNNLAFLFIFLFFIICSISNFSFNKTINSLLFQM